DIDIRAAVGPELFKALNVLQGSRRRIGFLISSWKRIEILGRDLITGFAIMLEDRLTQTIVPSPDDPFNRPLQIVFRRIFEAAFAAPNDDVDANHGTFGKERREGFEAPAKRFLKNFDNLDTDLGVVALARYIDEGRYEAFEPVAPDKHSRPWREARLQNSVRNPDELLCGHLEQLIARKCLKHIQKRALRETARWIARSAQDFSRLLAKQWDAEGRKIVCARRKQPRNTQLPGDLASLAMKLDSDDIHMRPAVDRRLVISFCDNDR